MSGRSCRRSATLPWLAAAGAAALVAYSCMFYAFEHGRLTVAVPIMPSVAGHPCAALSRIAVFGERLAGRCSSRGGAVVVAGALVVSRYAHAERGARTGRRGFAVAGSLPWIGAAIGFGVLMPLMGRLVPAFGSIGAVVRRPTSPSSSSGFCRWR